MANAVEAGVSNGRDSGGGGGGPGGGRSPRLPRWTRQEILVLIKGKRAVESRGRVRGRRGGGVGGDGEVGTAAPVEPKWASVSSYCRRHGVNRGAVQCRKRWSNLAGDFKKIKEWEARGNESFWTMRNDLRRERRLPGFFHRDMYDILDGADLPEPDAEIEPAAEENDGKKGGGLTPPLDSRPTETEDASFSSSEEEKEAEEEEEDDQSPPPQPVAAVPISEKNCESSGRERTDSGEAMATDKQQADEDPEKGSPLREGRKRRRTSPEGDEDDDLQTRLIKILDRNSRTLTAQLEVQNLNFQLDRDERKDLTNGLLGVLGKLADALDKIADKL